MFSTNYKRFILVVVGVVGTFFLLEGWSIAQTKQLKDPSTVPSAVTDNPTIQQGIDQNQTHASNPSTDFSNSYSVVIENKTTPDGKILQTRKVWQNGNLVQEEEKTIDSAEAQKNLEATIQLPNGQIAQGSIFSSENDEDIFSVVPSSPFEVLRQIEEQMRIQQEKIKAQFEALRQQLTAPNTPPQSSPLQQLKGIPNKIQGTSNKYWIGATVESVPEFLQMQLPIDEGQGVWIQYVVPESPAAKAGLKRFDVLYKIGDKLISNPLEVSNVVEELGGQRVKITFLRKGRMEETELTVEERPIRNTDSSNTLSSQLKNKSFRVVRPGLIIPSTETDSQIRGQIDSPTPSGVQTTNESLEQTDSQGHVPDISATSVPSEPQSTHPAISAESKKTPDLH